MTIVATTGAEQRLGVLDGWRAFSILLVLGAHMLPLGPHGWGLNEAAGYGGMAIFFTLSGFLITVQLHRGGSIAGFFIRRLFRILPLAWLVILAVAILLRSDPRAVLAHLGFTQNYLHARILPELVHFWSLCIEMHFYLFAGLVAWAAGARMFVVLPTTWLVMVAVRTWIQPAGTIETHLRVDEILSGTLLATAYLGKFGPVVPRLVGRIPSLLLIAALFATCLPLTRGPLHGLRGLTASLLVGSTLLTSRGDRVAWLGARPLKYVAEISYALYVLHPFSMVGWLGAGTSSWIKYAKRPICFALTFLAAHVSTFHFEHRYRNLAKAWCRRIEEKRRAAPGGGPPTFTSPPS
jgi:peptidoglycan/LPS O-acetylase OafA/YrhL